MNHAGRLVVVMAATAAGLSACGPRRVQAPQPSGPTVVVLLPDPDTGAVGRAIVSNPDGSTDLATARASTQAAPGRPPTAATTLDEAAVQRLFGDALSALPPAPRSFTLFFRFDSDELTDESRALVADVLQAVRGGRLPEVAVVGHTDTTGSRPANADLGLKRASMVRTILIDAGVDSSLIDVSSHGEGDLLVPTADEVFEPRNRRVEITVK
jgi:outer membrane protein OmpA-like peptidoglycan-associated protein